MAFEPFLTGKYLFLEEIGSGGMAKVYRAIVLGESGFRRQVAIKEVHPKHADATELLSLFQYEAVLAAKLHHPNIIQIYDFIREENKLRIVMEFVEGEPLSELASAAARNGTLLPMNLCCHIVAEVCRGLQYAHEKKDPLTGNPLNIVHRDISPHNIMISYDGHVKVVDFGIAKGQDRTDFTRTGFVRGKLRYLAPEQILQAPVDHRADIFALGAVLYEILAGEPAFGAVDEYSIFKSITEQPTPTLSFLREETPEELESVVERSLEKKPDERYQSAAHFLQDLDQFAGNQFRGASAEKLAELMDHYFAPETKRKRRHESDAIVFSRIESDSLVPKSEVAVPPLPPPVPEDPGKRPEVSWTRRVMMLSSTQREEFSWQVVGLVGVLLVVLVIAIPLHLHSRRSSVPQSVDVVPTRVESLSSPSVSSLESCSVELISEPPGSDAMVEGKRVGKTPTQVSSDCGKPVKITLSLEGYETQEFVATPDKKGARISRALASLPPGTLELLVSRDAKVFMGKDLIGEVRGGETLQLSLPSARSHSFRFELKSGNSVIREFSVAPSKVTNAFVRLD